MDPGSVGLDYGYSVSEGYSKAKDFTPGKSYEDKVSSSYEGTNSAPHSYSGLAPPSSDYGMVKSADSFGGQHANSSVESAADAYDGVEVDLANVTGYLAEDPISKADYSTQHDVMDPAQAEERGLMELNDYIEGDGNFNISAYAAAYSAFGVHYRLQSLVL